MSLQGKRILLGVTGGIAAYKACELLRLLVKAGADVEVMMTKAAAQFVGPLTFETLSGKPVNCAAMNFSMALSRLEMTMLATLKARPYRR